MPNHFHLGIRFKEEKELLIRFIELHPDKIDMLRRLNYSDFLLQQFSNFLNSYVKSYNKYYNRKGKLFLEHLKRSYVGNDSYYSNLIHYIHYNPVHHGFCKAAKDWEHSSYGAILSDKPSLLLRKECIDIFGNKENFITQHTLPPKWDEAEDFY